MHFSWQALFFIALLLLLSTIQSSFADTTILSPRQQIQHGALIWNVVCLDDLALMRNWHTYSVACVRVLTGEKLIQRGWELLKNPNYRNATANYDTLLLEVSRDLDIVGYQYSTFSQDKLSSYPELVYAMKVADLDYDSYIAWAKRTGCDTHICERPPPSPEGYSLNIDENEARKMIVDLGFHDIPNIPTQQNLKSSGHGLHIHVKEKNYNIAILGITMP